MDLNNNAKGSSAAAKDMVDDNNDVGFGGCNLVLLPEVWSIVMPCEFQDSLSRQRARAFFPPFSHHPTVSMQWFIILQTSIYLI
jgi:hypothetical protein